MPEVPLYQLQLYPVNVARGRVRQLQEGDAHLVALQHHVRPALIGNEDVATLGLRVQLIVKGPAVGGHPVSQVGGRGLPVQLWKRVSHKAQTRVQQLHLGPILVRYHLAVTAQEYPALHVHKLMAGMVRAPTALSGPETEAAGTALGVSSVQGEGPQAALVTP